MDLEKQIISEPSISRQVKEAVASIDAAELEGADLEVIRVAQELPIKQLLRDVLDEEARAAS